MEKKYIIELSINSIKRKAVHCFEYKNEEEMIEANDLFNQAMLLSDKEYIGNVWNIGVNCFIKYK